MWIKIIYFKHTKNNNLQRESYIVVNQPNLENHRKQGRKRNCRRNLEDRSKDTKPQVGGYLKAKGCKWEILDKHKGVFIPSSKLADTGAHQTWVTWVG